MAIFSVLHIFSFPWKPYAIGQEAEFDGSGKANFYGGPFGLKALLDAFNPWDQIKAVARGTRWLFVGRKRRTLDPSYQKADESIALKPDIEDTHSTGYPPSPNNMPTAYGGAGPAMAGEERQELLSNAQANPTTRIDQSNTDMGSPFAYDDDIDDYERLSPEPEPMEDAYRPPYPGFEYPSYPLSPSPESHPNTSYRPYRPQPEPEERGSIPESPFRPPPRE